MATYIDIFTGKVSRDGVNIEDAQNISDMQYDIDRMLRRAIKLPQTQMVELRRAYVALSKVYALMMTEPDDKQGTDENEGVE